MIYTTKYLKCESFEYFLSECEKVGLVVNGEITTSSHNHHLLLLPELFAPTGVMLTDSEGNEYQEMKKLDGYHANLKYKQDVGLNHLAIELETPIIT